MSNSNKNARRKLEQTYGKGCFFTRAEIAKRIEKPINEEKLFIIYLQ